MSQTVRAYAAASATRFSTPASVTATYTPPATTGAARFIPSSPAMKLSTACAASAAPCRNSAPATSSASAAWSIVAASARPASIIWSNTASAARLLPINSHDRHDGQPTYGGYAQSITVSEAFVLKVPENLDIKAVPPLLCAGITTWSPLRHWNIGAGSRVGVVGLGGLGHMAIKLAHALGAEVALFTRSLHKADDARRLGADRIIHSGDSAQMQAAANQFDLIIDTVPYTHDANPYLPTLKLDGTLVFVGLIGQTETALNTVPLVMQRRTVAGSLIGGIAETQELLDFCGKHNITADVELINMADINAAYERMLKSDVKYRFVIDMATL